jgi:micrococcal nuclease
VLERSDRVRLIGVEPDVTGATPPGSDAAGIEGACVRFDYEPTNLIDGHRDRDGRLLAYVYLQDGTFVNVEWIRAGRVRASNERHQHMAEFLAAQSLARRAGVGVWGR